MKRLTNYIIIAVSLAAGAAACKKPMVERFVPPRMFTPTELNISQGDTAATLSWPASLFSSGSSVGYTLEISQDSSFQSTADLSLTVDTTFRTVSDDTLKDRTPYFARIRANATDASTASNWLVASKSFSLVGVQIFQPVQYADILDVEVILRWTPTPGVDRIVLTPAGGDTTGVPISDADNTAGMKLIRGLTGSTTYTAEIFAGTRSKGIVSFTTRSSVTGNSIIDLRGIADPMVLVDTLPQIPDGSIVLLDRGSTYTVPVAYTLDRSVSIMSGLGFGDPATILLSNNFDATGNIDSVLFSDVTIANDGNSSYFMNVGHVASIGTLTIENCNTRGVFNNSFIRLKTSGDDIASLVIRNCVIDSFGVASKYAVLYANASSNAKIDNIEIDNSTFYSFYYFIRQDGIAGTSLNITNCTFNDMVNQGGYFVNYSGTFPATFTINNSILGRVSDPANSNGMKSTTTAVLANTYQTSDCVFSANPLLGSISYAGTSYDLFTDPDHGNFTIKDGGFAGAGNTGDPRWR